MCTASFSFQAEILPGDGGGAYVVVSEDWPPLKGKARLAVVAHFNGVEYRGSVVKMGGIYCLLVRKDIRALINKKIGDSITVNVTPDTAKRVAEMPPELKAVLAENQTAQSIYSRTAYSRQKEICDHISAAQKPETRTRRASAICEQLSAMGQPPAWFAELLAQHPAAQTAFNALAVSHQQDHLAYILEARKPETQHQRALKCFKALLAH